MILTENLPKNRKRGWRKGRKQSKEHIAKRINTRRLRHPEWHTAEQREEMSRRRKGIPKSEETKLKMSEAHKGKKGGLMKSMNMSIAMRRDDIQRKLRRRKKHREEEGVVEKGLQIAKDSEEDFFETAERLRRAEEDHLRRRTAERRWRD